MLFNMPPLHSGHSGVDTVASSSRIQALQSLLLHLQIGTGDNSGLLTSASKTVTPPAALTCPNAIIFIQQAVFK